MYLSGYFGDYVFLSKKMVIPLTEYKIFSTVQKIIQISLGLKSILYEVEHVLLDVS